VDDRGARHLPVAHARPHRLADAARRDRWLRGLGAVERVLLSSEPFAFEDRHRVEVQALCPAAQVLRVDGELLSWYGSRAVAGLRYLRTLADDDNAAPRPPL